MTTYKVVPPRERGSKPKTAANCNCAEAVPAPDPCWHPPPSCSRYPAVITMPEDLVDPDCQRGHQWPCGGSSICVASPFYWWWPS